MPLELTNLSFAYHPGTPVLRGVAAIFEPGLLTAVLGPNGSGKSTLLRCMLGLLRPDAGTVSLDGRDIHGLAEPDRAGLIAYIPQRPSVAFGFSVVDIVALGCGPRTPAAAARSAAVSALGAVDLADRAEEPFSELSMGQQQRVVLARAIAQLRAGESVDKASGATIGRALLADEPTSAMDPRHAVESMELLRAEAGRGRVVVVVLHDLTAALRSADRVLLLDEAGSVAAEGAADAALDPEALRRVFAIDFTRLTDPATGAEALVPAARPAGR